jgi:hypothetical protein
MANPRGKTMPLSLGRRLVGDLLHHAKQVPSLPLARDCWIDPLIRARAAVSSPPSWTALFMKAYGIVAARIPELRRSFIPYPWARLYEHPRSECAILVERAIDGEPTVLAAKIIDPVLTPLYLIDKHLKRFQEDELVSISPFRQLMRLGRLPKHLRRFLYWTTLYFSGYKRAKRFGTFMMSSLGNLGVEQIHPLTPLTTYFTFGPIRADGWVNLKIIYDHRVMDGRTVARALVDLESTLNRELVAELGQRSEVRGQRSEVRDQKLETRSQESEVSDVRPLTSAF